MQTAINGNNAGRVTRVLPIHKLNRSQPETESISQWTVEYEQGSAEAKAVLEAAEVLRTSNIPVAFPTETVYGLGADATRSAAVRGIYEAKQRPSDNPLIVHFGSREQLERLLRSPQPKGNDDTSPIPKIYEPLMARFWPGPLTIILPNPTPSPLAPEVTSNLTTFGARMPSSPLARLLIQLADRPLAAPSANASTKPSPTTAQHVYTDLQGRIDIILDGGPCGVGVESTVVDGLSSPPAILRPGGIGIDELRTCPGWETVRVAYKDGALQGKTTPRAPGMKYRHYSPKAKVVLFESGQDPALATNRIIRDTPVYTGPENKVNNPSHTIGVVRTRSWKKGLNMTTSSSPDNTPSSSSSISTSSIDSPSHIQVLLQTPPRSIDMLDIDLGDDPSSIARGLFSALRSLDERNVSVIYVEGISDTEGDLAAAVMNRLRKAAEEEIKVVK